MFPVSSPQAPLLPGGSAPRTAALRLASPKGRGSARLPPRRAAVATEEAATTLAQGAHVANA